MRSHPDTDDIELAEQAATDIIRGRSGGAMTKEHARTRATVGWAAVLLLGALLLCTLLLWRADRCDAGPSLSQAEVAALHVRLGAVEGAVAGTAALPLPAAAHAIPRPPTADREPRLADGCHHVYLDLGTNTGVQIRKLFEPSLFPRAQILPRFDSYFGPFPARSSEVCAFGFEPNPRHTAYLDSVESSYNAKGWRTHIEHAGVGVQDGQLHFDRSGFEKFDGENDNWGGHFVDEPHQSTELVPVIKFSTWMQYHILDRLLPSGPADRAPTIVMKVDIEGFDTAVIGSLIASGGLCRVNYTYVEHMDAPSIQHVNAVHNLAKCDSLVEFMDDESYHKERPALPK